MFIGLQLKIHQGNRYNVCTCINNNNNFTASFGLNFLLHVHSIAYVF